MSLKCTATVTRYIIHVYHQVYHVIGIGILGISPGIPLPGISCNSGVFILCNSDLSSQFHFISFSGSCPSAEALFNGSSTKLGIFQESFQQVSIRYSQNMRDFSLYPF